MKEKKEEKKEEKTLHPFIWTIIISLILIIIILSVGFFIYKNIQKSSSKEGNVKNILNELKIYTVEINKIGFVPPVLNIKEGDKVIWTNKEKGYFHNVVSINDTELISEKLLTNQNYTHVFLKKGIYEYNCIYHPYTKGKVIVGEI